MTHHPLGVRIRKSRAGLGLFATKIFTRGERIIEYTGERMSHDEANKRGGKYLFIMNEDIVIDGKGREHTARYANHGCKPNAEAIFFEETMQVHIVAKRAIQPEEEITYNYGKEYWKSHIAPHGCRCDVCVTK
jgi:uncharacterized protein